MREFDNFVAIDWSGAKGDRLKGIAIAMCSTGNDAPTLVHGDRRWSRQQVLNWLLNELPANSLVGLDLSPGLPFAADGGFFPGWDAAPTDAKALWTIVDQVCATDPHLAATSFVQHAEVRRHFRHGRGDCGDRFEPGKGRLRETEKRQRSMGLSPSSCFNLVGAAQVGKSSLTGMRLLNRLNGRIPIWPFDEIPADGSLIVEIYTSIAARAAGMPPGRSKMLSRRALDDALAQLGTAPHAELPNYSDHATDAILTAAWMRIAVQDEQLWTPHGLDAVCNTEGWTFGVR